MIERRCDDEMQRDEATIKQSRRDEMRQGARYNDEARRDATTRILDDDGRLDDNEMQNNERQDTAQ